MNLTNANIFTRDGIFESGSVCIDGDKISKLDFENQLSDAFDCKAYYLVPGFIDIHFHGCAGYDFCEETKDKDGNTGGVHAMKLESIIVPTKNCMVIEKADGVTVNKYIENMGENAQEIVEKNLSNMQKQGELQKIIDEAEKQYNNLLDFAKNWTEEGMFKSNFYHGDLHAGNLMLGQNGVTVIDFGNAVQVDETQSRALKNMLCAATLKDTGVFVESFRKLINQDDKEMLKNFDEKREKLTKDLKQEMMLKS